MAELTPREQQINDHEQMKRAIEAKIQKVEYFNPPYSNGVLAVLTLLSGFELTGYSACADEEDGQGLAYTDALNKLWEFETYLLAELNHGRPV